MRLRPRENVGLVTEMISPYRISVFNALDELLGGRLRVLFLSERAGRTWPVYSEQIRFRYRVLPGRAFQPRGAGAEVLYLSLPAPPYLVAERVGPVIVGGYHTAEYAWSRVHTRLVGRPLVLWSESIDAAERSAPAWLAVKRAAVGIADSYAVPGIRAQEQLEFLGAQTSRIATAPNSVDVDFWAAAPVPAVTRDERRLIFVGTLVPRKGLDVLLDALDTDDLRDVPLDVVGEGPERASLEARARTLDVSFHGDAEPERVRELYHRAAAIVVPSRADPWGVVLNEGMAAGCVPVASTAAGATADLVEDGVTGFAVPSDDPDALRSALRRLLDDREQRSQMAAAARARSMANSPQACARGLMQSVEVGLGE